MEKYPILARGNNAIILEISSTEVGKVLLPNHYKLVDVNNGNEINIEAPTLENEITSLQFCNKINNLLPKFIRTEKWIDDEGVAYEMIVLERIYSLPFNHFDVSTRNVMFMDFKNKLNELHTSGFLHGDIIRPTSYFNRGDKEWMMGNVLQTENELRLLDTGFSKNFRTTEFNLFKSLLFQELQDVEVLKHIYLSF